MLEVLAVAAVDEGELAAGARVDLGAHHPPGRGREEKFAGDLGVEPGVEDALRRGVEAAGNAYRDRGRFAHRCGPPRASERARSTSSPPAEREEASAPPQTLPSGARAGADPS